MDTLATKTGEGLPQHIECNVLGVHKRQKLFQLQSRRSVVDQRARRIDDVARCKEQFATVFLDDFKFFLRARVQVATGGILVALREVVRLNHAQIFKRCRIFVDDDVVDHLKRSEIERAQILRHVRTVHAFVDVTIRGEAGNEDAGLTLCIEQMSDVARMNNIEHAVTHNDLIRPWGRPENVA